MTTPSPSSIVLAVRPHTSTIHTQKPSQNTHQSSDIHTHTHTNTPCALRLTTHLNTPVHPICHNTNTHPRPTTRRPPSRPPADRATSRAPPSSRPTQSRLARTTRTSRTHPAQRTQVRPKNRKKRSVARIRRPRVVARRVDRDRGRCIRTHGGASIHHPRVVWIAGRRRGGVPTTETARATRSRIRARWGKCARGTWTRDARHGGRAGRGTGMGRRRRGWRAR